MEDVRKQEKEKEMFKRGELLGWFMARKLFGWSDKRYNEEYWARLERNWRQWKGGRIRGRRTMETIKEEEDKSGVREWTEEDDEEMSNMVDPYYEL